MLHISSMPSDYGVGVFDENVIHFIDKIADMGFTYWQVLPFNPITNQTFTTARRTRQTMNLQAKKGLNF